ncbi:hypothetical protein EauS123_00052 [Exiguobacterium phage vB_EauS-123]|nr:hypothetical protein EauS123_00052 [Exiguobacterium phage vB_EauS-123]
MDRLFETVQDHEKRINSLEKANLSIGHQIELLAEQMKGMKSNFAEVQQTVVQEGEKSRTANEKLIERFDKSNDRLWKHIEEASSYEQMAEQAAAEREQETKRTKLQIVRDWSIAGGVIYLIVQEVLTRYL